METQRRRKLFNVGCAIYNWWFLVSSHKLEWHKLNDKSTDWILRKKIILKIFAWSIIFFTNIQAQKSNQFEGNDYQVWKNPFCSIKVKNPFCSRKFVITHIFIQTRHTISCKNRTKSYFKNENFAMKNICFALNWQIFLKFTNMIFRSVFGNSTTNSPFLTKVWSACSWSPSRIIAALTSVLLLLSIMSMK